MSPINTVRIKRLDPKIQIPRYETKRAAGFDLALYKGIVLEPYEVTLATTGLVFGIPSGHMLYITHRSSTPRKWGITIMTGILDEDYCGDEDECMLQILNMERTTKTIPAGTRIAQGVLIPITRGIFTLTDKMGESRGGFGSTDTKRPRHNQ